MFIKTQATANACIIKRISAKTSAFEFSARGNWKQIDKKSRTHLRGNLQIHDLSQALKQWDQTPVLSAKSGHAEMNLTWPGAPYDVAFGKANGNLNLRLHNGMVNNLSPELRDKVGLGKLITFFNLRSIPRRLRLDFSDITHPGLNFTDLTGSFRFVNGRATTQDTKLTGTVAGIKLNGKIDFAKKTYHLLMKVNPHITSSLPIIATIAGGPIAGAATFLAYRLLQPELKRATLNRFWVTGPWKKPKVTPG